MAGCPSRRFCSASASIASRGFARSLDTILSCRRRSSPSRASSPMLFAGAGSPASAWRPAPPVPGRGSDGAGGAIDRSPPAVHAGVRIGPREAPHEQPGPDGVELRRRQMQPTRHLLGRDIAGLDRKRIEGALGGCGKALTHARCRAPDGAALRSGGAPALSPHAGPPISSTTAQQPQGPASPTSGPEPIDGLAAPPAVPGIAGGTILRRTHASKASGSRSRSTRRPALA